MSLFRAIARLDIKGSHVVKGIRFEGLRRVGEPAALAERYAESGADELLYIDQVASLYGRNQLEELLERTTERVFIPVTVGGGISSLADVRRLLNAGADKVAVNTAAIRRPDLINEIAGRYGNQCLVVSIEAKRTVHGWEAYTDCGRERSGVDAVAWARRAAESGAGELLVTSIDQDGTMKGMDYELIAQIGPRVDVPVVAAGGIGNRTHVVEALRSGADAIAVASALHYNRITFEELRNVTVEKQFPHETSGTGRTRTA
ncbi:MAG: imidazole glycerol phosphate synthase cyclase subunit [Candidatus Brocadiia bacterium]